MTWYSCIASSRAACVFGGVRLISSASTTWAKAGGALFPYKDQDLTNYPSQLYQTFAKDLSEATNVRFDGSDLMPSAVGAGSFWSEMLKMVGGQDVDTTMTNIDATWPS